MRCRRIFGVLFFLLIGAARANAATLTFDSATVNVQDTFGVQIRVLNVTDLFTFGFDLAYDPAVVQFLGADEGSFLPSAVVTPPSDPNFPNMTFFFGPDATTPGLLSLVSGTLAGPDQVSGATGSGVLATIRFLALATGNAGLAIQNALLLDSAFPQGNVIETGIDNRSTVSVAQSTVPEPAVLVIFAIGLLGVARRFR